MAVKAIRHEPALRSTTYIHFAGTDREYQFRHRDRVVCPCGFDKKYDTAKGASIGFSAHKKLRPYIPGLYRPSTEVMPWDIATKVHQAMRPFERLLADLQQPEVHEAIARRDYNLDIRLAWIRDTINEILPKALPA